MTEIKLTIKQEAFCNKYIECGNASEAYLASYDAERMSVKTRTRKAHELLKHEGVAARIAELQTELKERSDFKKDDAVNALADIINVNVLDFISIEDDTLIELDEDSVETKNTQTIVVKNLDQLSKAQQKCIKSITPARGGIKIEFYDKIQAIDKLSKLFGWDTPDKVEHSGVINANISIVPLKKGKQTFASNENEVD